MGKDEGETRLPASPPEDHGKDRGEKRLAEEKLRQVIDLVPHAIFAKDGEGRYLLANQAVANFFGTTVQEVLSKTIFELAHSTEDAARFHAEDLEVIASGKPLMLPEESITDPEGNVRLIQAIKIPFTVSQSRTEAVLGVAIDVTEQRRREESERKLEAELRETRMQKLETIGILAGGIAHDFNNILVGIMGYAELALLSLAPDAPARSKIEKIIRAAERAAALIKQLLLYSGQRALALEKLDLSRVVDDIRDLLQMSISKKVRFETEFHRDALYVEVDPAQLHQVIMNLIMNASDAAEENSGTIRLRSGVMRVDRAYLARPSLQARPGLTEGEYAYLEVVDDGCGMDEATRARMFDPFFTTKPTGRGLGLAAVLGIVHAHGGAIDVESAPGRGTTVRVLLPRVATPQEARPSEAVAAPPQFASGSTILVVDDEKMIRDLAAETLQAAGLRILLAENGAEAVEIFRRNADEITAVLLDLTMPVMSGERALRELRRIRPDVRVLLSSGYKEKTVVKRLGGEPMAGYLQKPYSGKTLTQTISQLVASQPTAT